MNEKFIPTTELLQLNPVTFINFADFERIKLPKLNRELLNLNDPLIFLNNFLHAYAIPLGLRVTIVPYDLMFIPPHKMGDHLRRVATVIINIENNSILRGRKQMATIRVYDSFL